VSKYGVVALSEILRRELAEDSPNVGVTVLVPTATATNIVASSRDVLPAADREMTSGEISRTEVTRTRLAEGMSADAVADVAWHAYQDRRFWAMAADVTAEWVMERALEIQASTPSALARAGSSESKGSK
jgi:short-subunit dehydrogenase